MVEIVEQRLRRSAMEHAAPRQWRGRYGHEADYALRDCLKALPTNAGGQGKTIHSFQRVNICCDPILGNHSRQVVYRD